jgi:hypothetical protein
MVGSHGHSLPEIFHWIITNEGWPGLFRGNAINVIRVAPSKTIEVSVIVTLSLSHYFYSPMKSFKQVFTHEQSKLEIANRISSRFSQIFFLGELQIWHSFFSFVVFQLLCCWHLQQHDQLFEQLLDRERACDLSSRGCSDDENEGGGGTTRKKFRLSKEQSAILEKSFKDHSTLNPV